jgi:hypothetical protein
LLPSEHEEEPLEVIPVLSGWVRGSLVGIALGLVTVFVIACRLDPYERGTLQDRPEVLAVLAPAPDVGFPANLPWAGLCLSAEVPPATPRRMETHRQRGLPPCTFFLMTEMPCPSCGMTTSFALLMRGDVWNSVRANAVGTLLALFGLAVVPWSLACAFGGRTFFVVSLERALVGVIITFLVLMLLRWAIVLAALNVGRLSG